MDLKEILETEMWKVLAEEGIEKYIVDMVDLEIADDIVQDKMHGVCKTQKTNGGNYILVDFDNPSVPLKGDPVSPEHLKIMRARYLLRRGEYSEQLPGMSQSEQRRICHYYNLDLGTSDLLNKLRSITGK